MTTRDASVRIEDLLTHRQWVRELAVALTRDPAEADDVVQQTWLAALRRPPRHGGSPRGWLATVVRNVVRERGRSRGRRARREAAVAHPETVDSEDPAELTARAELHAHVAAAVVALDEPYRRAILLRHYEDLPVAEVARRMGTPLETARARLRRGRAQLRSRLESEIGDGRGLALALLPLTGGNAATGSVMVTSSTTAAIGGAVMAGKTTAAVVVAILLLVAGVLLWPGDGDESSGEVPTASAPAEDLPAVDATTGFASDATRDGDALAGRAREHVGRDAAAAPESEPSPPAGTEDASEPGEDVPSVEPAAEAPRETASERLRNRPATFELQNASLEEILGRLSWYADVPIDLDARVVGDVRDRRSSLNFQGAAVFDALRFCTMIASLEIREEPERVVLHPKDVEWSDGLAVVRVTPLEPPENLPPVALRGRVVDGAGVPVPGARVTGLPEEIVTDAEGRFACEVAPRSLQLTAWKSGHQRGKPVTLSPPYDPEVVVVLGPPAALVEVVVRGTDGEPIQHALVTVRSAAGSGDVGRTDADGRVELGHAPPGPLTVVALADAHGRELRQIQAPPGETTSVDIRLPKRTLAERVAHERTTLVLDRIPLSHVVPSLYGHWDVNVRVAAELPPEIASRIIDVRIDDDTLEGALRTICDAAGCTFRVDARHQMVWIDPR